MSKYLEIFRTKRSWLEVADVLEVMETAPMGGYKDLPTVSVDAKTVVCLHFATEPREVKKGTRTFLWTEANLLEPAECWFKDTDETKELPAGTEVAIDIGRHAALRRCLKQFEPLTDKDIAIANLGMKTRRWKGKTINGYDYRAMLYEDLKKKVGKKA